METSHPRQNLEIKAACPNPAAARDQALRLAGAPHAILQQIDTYFDAPFDGARGRLKLREINQTSAELIFYHRRDDPAARLSRYHLAPVADPAAMKALLSAAFGVLTVVRKRRELFLYENVRIHLDMVENLGSFIELEAVLADESSHAESLQRLEHLTGALAILPEHRIAGSYAELVRSNR